MAATNPFKASDLVAKYGWQIMPYLSNLGAALLCESQILFVDSGATNKLDADDTEHGHSFQKPLATLGYAVGLCTADQGDVILLAPGHAETLSGASDLDIDVAGITVIGIGIGTQMPTFTLGGTDAATTVEINGDNITLKNLRFEGGDEGGTTVCLDVQECDYLTLDGLIFWEPTATMEIFKCITLADKTNQVTIKNCLFMNGATGSNTAAIATEADEHAHLRIENCVFQGDWTDAALDLDAQAIVYPIIKDCLIINVDATAGEAITLNSATVAVVVDCRIASGKGTSSYPCSDTTATFSLGTIAGEANTVGIPALGNATETDFS